MSKKMVVLVGVLVFLLGGSAVFGFLVWKHKDELVASPVSFTVNAEGWSEETSSPIPVRVTGQTVNKDKVDTKYFIGHSDGELKLKPGEYEVEVYASPVNADGGMYRCPKAVKLTVPKNTDKSKTQPNASGAVVSAELDLSPVPANEITDEEIEKAQEAMEDAGLNEAKIKTFTDSARTARQAELDRLEKERKAKEEAERKKAMWGPLAGQWEGAEGTLSLKADGTGVYAGEFATQESVERFNVECISASPPAYCTPDLEFLSFNLTFSDPVSIGTFSNDIDSGSVFRVTANEQFKWSSHHSIYSPGTPLYLCQGKRDKRFQPADANGEPCGYYFGDL